MLSRRKMLIAGAAALGGGAALPARAAAAQAREAGGPDGAPAQRHRWKSSYSGGPVDRPALAPGEPGKDYLPVRTPDGAALPWKLADGVKVFHLVAEAVRHRFAPGLEADCWGYNGRVHGPTIEAVEGDRVRVYVTNKLPAPTTVHWHGVYLPCGMDGVGGLTQRAIPPGETFRYEWTFRQHGTFMYHSHHDEMTQMAMGMMGMIVVHPRAPAPEYRVERDFALMLSEWSIRPGTRRPDVNAMSDFNVLTMNGRCFPGTAPLVARLGDRVRLRLGNLSAMDHHPIHLHGYHFTLVATDGGEVPPEAQWPETTVLVPTGSTRDVELIADAPGDWALHCHMTHHVMNQMGHGIPNLIGMDPGDFDERVARLLPGYMTMGQIGMGEHGLHIERGHMAVPPNSIPMVGGRGPFDYITMGGMFSILKVRESLDGDGDPGWYRHPPGTVAEAATPAELERDGIRAAAAPGAAQG